MWRHLDLKNWFKQTVSLDDILLYVARGCKVHPLLHDHLYDQLEDMERKGKVCLTPSSVLHVYHRKLRRKQCKSYNTAA